MAFCISVFPSSPFICFSFFLMDFCLPLTYSVFVSHFITFYSHNWFCHYVLLIFSCLAAQLVVFSATHLWFVTFVPIHITEKLSLLCYCPKIIFVCIEPLFHSSAVVNKFAQSIFHMKTWGFLPSNTWHPSSLFQTSTLLIHYSMPTSNPLRHSKKKLHDVSYNSGQECI